MSADIDHASLKPLPAALAADAVRLACDRCVAPARRASRRKTLCCSKRIEGGRDYAERPEFYIPYEGDAALGSLKRAKALDLFFQKYPDQETAAEKIARDRGSNLTDWRYLPVVGRQDWVALLDRQGQIQGFLKGDGF